MNIIVCIKRVPQTAEAEVKVDSTGKDVIKDRLTFDINEYDSYALEEAILLKEKHGGTVTAVSFGMPDAEDTLRIALAKGADVACRIKAEEFSEIDGFKTAQIIKSVVKGLPHDIIMTGCMATDDASSMVGQTLAELLGISHAAFVTKLEIKENSADIYRELEGGLLEHLQVKLPVLVTIQSGINVPRYASLIAIRRAAGKDIKTIGKAEIAGEIAGNAVIEEIFSPPVGKRAEILTGSVDDVSTKLAGLVKEKGLL